LGKLLLTLDTRHAPPAVVHAEETHHPSARKLQSLPGKQAASGNSRGLREAMRCRILQILQTCRMGDKMNFNHRFQFGARLDPITW